MNEIQQILKERAKKISLKQTIKVSTERELEVLCFGLGGERYCIETDYVVEVHKEFRIIKVPTAPAFVLGIFNRRGKITTVIDLKVLLDIKTDTLTEKNLLIVIADKDKEFAFSADSLEGIARINESSIIKELPTLSISHTDYIAGMGHSNAVILNARKIINDNRIIVDEKVV